MSCFLSYRIQLTSSCLTSITKPYQLSDDWTVLVKKKEGQLTVTIKHKDSVDKIMEFPPNRQILQFIFLFLYYTTCFSYIVTVAFYVHCAQF